MTRQNWLYKWFVYALALLPVWWLDAYVLSRYPVMRISPVLLPAAVAVVGGLEGIAGGAGFGLGAGLLWATYPQGGGIRVILLLFAGMCTGAAAQYALAQTLLGCMLCSAAVLAVIEGLRVVQELFFLRAELTVLLRVAIPQLVWSLCWVPLIYALFRQVFRRVGGNRLA